MSLNDPLANVLSHITNVEKLNKKEVLVNDNNKTIRKVLDLMKENKYVGGYKETEGKLNISLLGKVNKANVIKPRFSVKLEDYNKFEKRFLPAKDFGFLVISTSKGLMTHVQAKENNLGGRLIAYCY
jgi:small subunit ribosomal protein S8